MEQYIPKSALEAGINQRIEDYKSHKIDDSYHDGLIFALEDLRDDFINTLEVKEVVDLEMEIDGYINEHFSECDDGVLISDANSTELTLLDVASIARHFFELGMTASNKAQKGE